MNFKRSIFSSHDTIPLEDHPNDSADIDPGSLLQGGDPLLLAFEPDEVEKYGRLAKPSAIKKDLPESDKSKVSLDQLKLAERAIHEQEPQQALRLCTEALRISGPNPLIWSGFLAAKSDANVLP